MLNIKNYKAVSPLHEKDQSLDIETIVELQQELLKKNELINLREQEIEEIKLDLKKTQEKLSIRSESLEKSQQNLLKLEKELNNSQRKIETSIQQLRTIVESAPASIALLDKDLKYMSVSQRWLKDHKIDHNVIGKSHYDIFPELPQHWKDMHSQCLRGEIKRNPGEKFVRYDGVVQWVKWEVRPWYLDQEVNGLVMMTEDITEQKVLRNQLDSSKANYGLLFNGTPGLLLRVNKVFELLEINDKFSQTFKISSQQIIGKSIFDIQLPDEILQHDLKNWQKIIQSKKSDTYYSSFSLNQKKLIFQVKVVPELNEQQEIDSLLIIYSDITQLRESENKIKSSQNKYETLVKHLPHRVLKFDASKKLIFDNQRNDIISSIVGGHLINLRLHEMGLDEEDVYIFEKNFQKVLESAQQIEWTHHYKKAQSDNFILHIACPEFNEQKTKIESVLIIGIDITELKIAEQNSQMLNEELSQLNEELSASNEELFMKQFELREVISELEQRNHELDNIVYKISHDIRAPLASILGLINIIKDDKDLDNILSYIDLIEGRALKLDDFIRKMLDFAKANRSENKPESIDFQELIEDTFKDLSYMKGFDTVETKVHVNLRDEKYFGDLLKLRIIFANIISNAIKYQNYFQDNSFLHISVDIDYKLLTISFKDNGMGIAEEHLSKICEIFYRANEKADGSGLGLYIVKQTIDKLKGKLKIRSKINKGTEIRVLLPVEDPESEE